jgi:hypothetical protein
MTKSFLYTVFIAMAMLAGTVALFFIFAMGGRINP